MKGSVMRIALFAVLLGAAWLLSDSLAIQLTAWRTGDPLAETAILYLTRASVAKDTYMIAMAVLMGWFTFVAFAVIAFWGQSK